MSLRPRITAFEVQRRVDVGSGPSTPESTLSRSASTATLSTNVPTPKHEEKTHILEFRVIDNGPGISPHLLEKVFEPFVQAEMRLAKVHEGVGLGLSICRQIIKMLGGSISLESEVDVGSIFTVQVPVGMRMREASDPPLICSKTPWGKDNKPHLASGSIIQGETELDGSLKILVAEDNPTNRTVIVQMLKLQKFLDVTLAKDGHEALAKIKEAMGKGEEFGVILMDIQMPGLDGIECTRTVRALGYTAPIVALTAFADEGNKNDCLDAGMNYFLPKPIDKHHLRAVLKTCMGFSCGTPLSSYIGTGLPTPPASATSMPMLGTPATELDSLTTPSAGPLKPPSP